MRDFSSWSINLGRWHGIHVRLHAFFLLFAVFTLYLSTRKPDHGLALYGLISLGILFLSVLAHEIGHCLAAARVGGSADQIVIGFLGGLTQSAVPHEPQAELITALAGPVVNVFICLITAPIILAGGDNLLGLLRPLEPDGVVDGLPWLIPIKLTFWLNWLLVLANLVLPAFPLDGGRILRSVLWRAFDYRTSVLCVAWVAKFVALSMAIVAAWFFHAGDSNGLVPAWVPLSLLAIFLFFSAKQEASRLDEREFEDELFSYDFSQGYTSLERNPDGSHRSSAGPLRRWVDSRREARRRRQQLVEQEEERRVDEILARLHEGGMQQLSPKERALLERVSVRYRNRQRS